MSTRVVLNEFGLQNDSSNLTAPAAATRHHVIINTLSENSLVSRGPLVFMLMLMILVGVVVNLVVIVVFLKRFPASAIRSFIVTMSVSDLVATGLGIPLHLVTILLSYNFTSPVLCKIYFVVTSLSTNCSGFIIVIFAVDRFRRVRRPAFKQVDRVRSYYQVTTAVVLAVMVTAPFVPVFGVYRMPTKFGKQYSLLMCWVADEYKQTVYPVIYRVVVAVTFSAGLGLMAGSYLMTGYGIHSLTRDVKVSLVRQYEEEKGPAAEVPLFDLLSATAVDVAAKESAVSFVKRKKTSQSMSFADRLHLQRPGLVEDETGLSTKTSKMKKLSNAVQNFFQLAPEKTSSSSSNSSFVSKRMDASFAKSVFVQPQQNVLSVEYPEPRTQKSSMTSAYVLDSHSSSSPESDSDSNHTTPHTTRSRSKKEASLSDLNHSAKPDENSDEDDKDSKKAGKDLVSALNFMHPLHMNIEGTESAYVTTSPSCPTTSHPTGEAFPLDIRQSLPTNLPAMPLAAASANPSFTGGSDSKKTPTPGMSTEFMVTHQVTSSPQDLAEKEAELQEAHQRLSMIQSHPSFRSPSHSQHLSQSQQQSLPQLLPGPLPEAQPQAESQPQPQSQYQPQPKTAAMTLQTSAVMTQRSRMKFQNFETTVKQLHRLRKKSITTMSALIAVFLLTWLPNCLTRLMQTTPVNFCNDFDDCWLNLPSFGITSIYIGSTFNAFLYCVGSVHFRKQVRILFKPCHERLFKKKPRRRVVRIVRMVPAQAAGAQGAGVQGAGVQGAGVQGTGVQGAGVQGAGVQGAGVQGTGVQGAGVQGAGVQGAGVQGTGVQGAGVQGAGVQGAGVQGAGVQGAGVQGTGVQEAGVQRAGVQGTGVQGETQGAPAAAAAAPDGETPKPAPEQKHLLQPDGAAAPKTSDRKSSVSFAKDVKGGTGSTKSFKAVKESPADDKAGQDEPGQGM